MTKPVRPLRPASSSRPAFVRTPAGHHPNRWVGNRPATGPVGDAELADVMAGVAAGDPLATENLWRIARPHLTWIVRDALRSTGRRFGHETVEDAVNAAFLGLMKRAKSWDPQGGAKPWNWARRMVRGCAFEALGVSYTDIDRVPESELPSAGLDGEVSAPALPPVEDPLVLLEHLAAGDPATAAVLAEYRQAVPKDRDLRVYLRMLVERTEGNPRPAVTVAALEGLTTGNVRQIFHRTGVEIDKLRSGRCADAAARPAAGPLRPGGSLRRRPA